MGVWRGPRSAMHPCAGGFALCCLLSAGQAQDAIPAGPEVGAGSVRGMVEDAGGAVIPEALVVLLPASGDVGRVETMSAADGSFVLRGVPPGSFSVTVTAQGFAAARAAGTLEPRGSLELDPVVLQVAALNTTVDAITLPTAMEQIHNEEHQRLVGVLPNFFVSYNWYAPPLTWRQKYLLAYKSVLDPGNLLLVGVTAGVQQADNAFDGYGQGAAGYGRRYGADMGDVVFGTFLGGAVLPSLFHQDPRYFYKGSGTVGQRLLYALSSAVICRGDNGRKQPAFASVLGDLSAGAVSNLYYPASNRNGPVLTLENGFLGVAGDALNDVFQEFILQKVTPKAKRQTISAP